jgi:hypothetical protein
VRTIAICSAACAAVVCGLPVVAYAEGPWLPIPGGTDISASYVSQYGDGFFFGPTKATLPATLSQETETVNVEHGFTDNFAGFAQIGYVRTSFAPVPNRDEGLSDSRIGVEWRIADEFAAGGFATVTLRGAAVIQGTYDIGRIDAPGNGASGADGSVAIGKQLNKWMAVWGEGGYRVRNQGVPDSGFISVGASVRPLKRVSLFAEYDGERSTGNLDIGGPGFTPARFQQTRQDRDTAKFGASYDLTTKLGIALSFGHVFSGRNVTLNDAYGVGVYYSF